MRASWEMVQEHMQQLRDEGCLQRRSRRAGRKAQGTESCGPVPS